jgi:Na+/H+ antiporter NhaD/arsenite permease-like protein
MHPLAMFFLGLFLIVQGVEYLGLTFTGSNIVKGICLTIAGAIFVWQAL